MVSANIYLPGYEIGEQIYLGSRTIVCRAVRQSDEKSVIVKLMRNKYPSFSELVQFRNQFIISSNLDIDEVVKPLSLETYNNFYALVMEDFGGISLCEYFHESQTRTLSEFFDVAIKIAIALDALQHESIIHKDIKPGNILINPSTKQVKLIDFSIASLLPKETQQLKSPNLLEGTLAYISPEQTGRMNRCIDYRTDFYSLGATFYHLLVQKLPFSTTDPMELVHSHITKYPPSVSSINPEIPQQLSDIVAKLMAKNADERYQSASGLKYDLELCQQYWTTQASIPNFVLGKQDLCERFIIPEKLYGREKEVAAILSAFERVNHGTCELMIVKGISGIGKTVVINEVHKPIVRQRGYFIKGKYDQFQRQIPLKGFVQAFRDLMEQLLGESDLRLKFWKGKILEALGENAQVIIEVIPELEAIIGSQPSVMQLEGNANQNRFNLLFKNFVQVFATSEHPLVIFLDDLQWADLESLKLMQLLMSEKEAGYLFIIGAYRDNEVLATHPLSLTLENIHESGIIINEIGLAALHKNDLNHLVADTLSCSLELALSLSEFVYQKTGGNPFFCTQFLKLIYDEELVKFKNHYWQCDISEIKQRSITDDIVELMTQQLQKLSIKTQDVLKLAACIGNQFDLNTLALVLEKSPNEAAIDLWKALQEGFILPANETYKFCQSEPQDNSFRKDIIASKVEKITIQYKFLHDRVQQAAYGLIPNEQKQHTHFKIGKLIVKNTSKNELDERIFDIVNHLNAGVELITAAPEILELTQLNLIAAKKAKKSTAYAAARDYLSQAINLLTPDTWNNQYELTFSLYREKAEIEYLNGNFHECETLVKQIIPYIKSNVEKAELYNIMVVQYTLQGKYLEGINVGRDALKLLDIDLPEVDLDVKFQEEYLQVKQLLAVRNIDSLIDLPMMQSQENIMVAKLLFSLDPVTYIGMPALYPIVSLKLVTLSLINGNIDESAKGYANYGVILCAFLQDYKSGYEFGLLAVNLSNKINNPLQKCRNYFILATFINHWHKHIRISNSINDEAYGYGLDAGEFQFAGYILSGKVINYFSQGRNLSDILSDLPSFFEFLQKTQNQPMIETVTAFELVMRNLSGLTTDYNNFSTTSLDESEFLHQCRSRQSGLALASYYISKTQALYIYGEYGHAYECAVDTQPYLPYVAGFILVAVYNFYHSLTLVNKYADTRDDELKTLYYEHLQKNQTQMKIWADSCPENFLHKYLLVEAEISRVGSENTKAMELYDCAIALAKENQYIHEEALACELAAKFYLEWNKPKIAQVYMTDAYYAYARWGAKAKVNQIEEHYPQLLALVLERQAIEVNTLESAILNQTVTHTATSSLNASVFQLASIMKASQAISSEIHLEKLLSVLMEVVLENAGASKSVLVLLKNGEMFVEASATITLTEEIATNIDSLPIEEGIEVPISVINYVKNSAKFLLINNIEKHANWLADIYIKNKQPQSVLCLPINCQGTLTGILYLENTNVKDSFTSDRVKLLQLICSQAAIAIKNAQLYERSQDYAKQLKSSFEELKKMQLQLVQSEKMSALGGLVAGIAHEINNPIGCISGNIQPAADYIQDLFEIIRLYQSEHTRPTVKLIKKIQEFDLEYIQEDLPKILDSMKHSIERIYDISVSLRTFSRSDTDKRIVCNIHECLNSTLLILKHRLKASKTRPEIEVIKNYSQIPEFACYPGQLNQVFMNLLANAIDALDESNLGLSYKQIESNPNFISITTSLHEDKQSILIAIKDNGSGMSDEVKAKVFEHLFTTKPVGKGTGLGLTIAHQIIVEKHAGSIQVNSSPGKGTEFIIQIPTTLSQKLHIDESSEHSDRLN